MRGNVTGLLPGVAYRLSFYAANRPSYSPAKLLATVVGQAVSGGALEPVNTGFTPFEATFGANGSTAVLSLENDSPDTGDRTVFVASVVAAAARAAPSVTMCADLGVCKATPRGQRRV